MANSCSTTFKFYGDADVIKDFKTKILDYTTPKNENDTTSLWLGNIIKSFGCADTLDPEINGQGVFCDIYNEHDEGFNLTTETPWRPMIKMWREIIHRHYADTNLGFTWLAEELENGLYCSDNPDSWSEQYCVDCQIDDCFDASGHYETEEEVVNAINEALSDAGLDTIKRLGDIDTYEFDNEDDYCNIYPLEKISREEEECRFD